MNYTQECKCIKNHKLFLKTYREYILKRRTIYFHIQRRQEINVRKAHVALGCMYLTTEKRHNPFFPRQDGKRSLSLHTHIRVVVPQERNTPIHLISIARAAERWLKGAAAYVHAFLERGSFSVACEYIQ